MDIKQTWKKRKFLVITDGNYLSHITRCLGLAEELKKKGHSVVFACKGRYDRLVEQEGFVRYPIFTLDADKALKRTRLFGSCFMTSDVEKYVQAEIALIEHIVPDVVIGDLRPSLSISCQVKHTPYVTLLNAYWTHYYAIPFTAPESMLIIKFLGKKISHILIFLIQKLLLRIFAYPFNKIRKRFGFSPCRDMFEVMASPDINLIVDFPEYAPCKNLPLHFKYIGPILWETGNNDFSGFPQFQKDKPTIYITMGSTGYFDFFKKALRMFTNRTYQVIMTTGQKMKLSDIPDNFIVKTYIPGKKVMEISDVVICHGGNGTIYQALSKGVPIIGIPSMHDQSFNMDRVEALGLGIKLSLRDLNINNLKQAINDIITEKRYRMNAKKFQDIIEQTDGAQRGVEEIERFIENYSMKNQSIIFERREEEWIRELKMQHVQ